MKTTLFRKLAPVLVVALVMATSNALFVGVAHAAGLTTLSDTMTNLNTSGTTSNDILFTVPSSTGNGFPLSGTISLTFASSTGTAPALAASIASTNLTVKLGPSTPSNTQTIASGTASAGSPVAATTTAWGFARTSATVLTLTAPSATASGLPVVAGTAVFFEIIMGTPGTPATYLLTHGGTANTETLAMATSPGDSGTVAVPIITNDQVVVTATVTPTITFTPTVPGTGIAGTLSNAVDFGALTSGAPRFASNGTGTGGNASASTIGLDLNIATNAPSGYTITYTAPTTLTDGSHPITGATISNSNAGTAGTAQFAMSAKDVAGSPSPGVVSTYLYNTISGSSNWNFATPATTTIASRSTATSVDTYNMRYMANIPASQAAGSYNVTITYIATGNF